MNVDLFCYIFLIFFIFIYIIHIVYWLKKIHSITILCEEKGFLEKCTKMFFRRSVPSLEAYRRLWIILDLILAHETFKIVHQHIADIIIRRTAQFALKLPLNMQINETPNCQHREISEIRSTWRRSKESH